MTGQNREFDTLEEAKTHLDSDGCANEYKEVLLMPSGKYRAVSLLQPIGGATRDEWEGGQRVTYRWGMGEWSSL
ncbi:hypothetical protein Rctr85_048 [Virus Rctr85]|nr:hypothetical protein Rctr85_048 [Virus Rctr85]